jgi:hypothetical protein
MTMLVSAAIAEEGGSITYPMGAETVMPAIDPGPHNYLLQTFTLFYSSSRFNDTKGNSAIPGFRLTEFANCVKLKHNWGVKFLGANLFTGAGIVMAYAQVEAGPPNQLASQTKTNLANQDIEPLFAVYNREDLHFHYGLDIWTPGPSYTRTDLVNVGSHYWQFEPNFAITYMPNHGKTEFSSRVHYAINTTNPDNNYHSGSYISWEFNATQNVTKTTALGFQGYLAKQVRDDTISGVRAGDGNRTQALGLGPEIRVAIPKGVIAFKYFRETDVRYHPVGNGFWFEFGLPINGHKNKS